MQIVDFYVDALKDECKGACEYAEMYIRYKSTNADWARKYMEMANQEIQHATNFQMMGSQELENLSYIPEAERERWEKCLKHSGEKIAMAKIMLTM